MRRSQGGLHHAGARSLAGLRNYHWPHHPSARVAPILLAEIGFTCRFATRDANMKEQWGGSSRWWLMAGSINMLLAVALGAFGAHALKASLPPDLMAVYQTGNQYHIYHALGLFAVAFAA